MRFKTLILYCKVGAREAKEMRLDRKENWTPLLVYIHVSRLILGAVLGFLAGILFGHPFW